MKKYKCNLELAGEDYSTGTMMLTKEEYETVKRVTNLNNWDDLEYHPWCGQFRISCDELDEKKRIKI